MALIDLLEIEQSLFDHVIDMVYGDSSACEYLQIHLDPSDIRVLNDYRFWIQRVERHGPGMDRSDFIAVDLNKGNSIVFWIGPSIVSYGSL